MATGVNGRERSGPDCLAASGVHADPHPLPSNSAGVQLSYPCMVAEGDILSPCDANFSLISRDGAVRAKATITPNAVVLSDNYFALRAMLDQGFRATLIYLDPPFCTGLDFQSRRMEHAYADKMGPAAYLEFMRRRLILLRELMTSDGSLYLHIGHQMVGHLKVMLDQLFGPKNFRNIITRRKCSSKNYTSRQYANLNDYLLFYSRGSEYKWNQPGELPDEDWIEREYPKRDKRGRFKLVPVHAPGIRRGETGKPWRGRLPPPGKHWQYIPSKLDEMDSNGEIHWSQNGNPRRKVYLEAGKSLPLTDYWPKYRDAHHQSIRVTGYPTEKNLEMLRLIVAASSSPGDVVLDPFCGSGTTLEAAFLEERHWVGIDESFTGIRATIRRLRHGVDAMGDYVGKRTQKPSRAQQELFDLSEASDAEPRVVARPMPSFDFLADAALLRECPRPVKELAAT